MIASYTFLHEKMATDEMNSSTATTLIKGVTSKVKHYSNDVEIFSRNHEDVDINISESMQLPSWSTWSPFDSYVSLMRVQQELAPQQ